MGRKPETLVAFTDVQPGGPLIAALLDLAHRRGLITCEAHPTTNQPLAYGGLYHPQGRAICISGLLEERQRPFVLAHELGHAKKHPEGVEARYHTDYGYKNAIEGQANELGRRLLRRLCRKLGLPMAWYANMAPCSVCGKMIWEDVAGRGHHPTEEDRAACLEKIFGPRKREERV